MGLLGEERQECREAREGHVAHPMLAMRQERPRFLSVPSKGNEWKRFRAGYEEWILECVSRERRADRIQLDRVGAEQTLRDKTVMDVPREQRRPGVAGR